MKKLWELLVPTERLNPRVGEMRPVRTRSHKVWDAMVRAISGGITILAPVKGQWISPTDTLHRERMIPVRIIATDEEIDKIMVMTAKFYFQEAVLAYEISSNIRMYENPDIEI